MNHSFLKSSIMFVAGILLGVFLVYLQLYGFENPLSITEWNMHSPQDWIMEKDIHIYQDKIVIDVSGASMSRYTETGSMIPIFDGKANGIRIIPASEDQIQAGDIITFERNGILVVHRVIALGQDNEGKFFITKGDNNAENDGKIRFKDIKYVTIGILY